MLKCFGCGAEVTNGLALCAMCIRSAELKLQYIGIYFTNLARWSPGRSGRRTVPGSREPIAPSQGRGDRVGIALDAASNMLTTRARELADNRAALAEAIHRGHDTDAATVTHLCTIFADNLTSMATLDWCGDLVRDLDQHEVILRTLTEQVAPGWYAGGCKRCESGTYVVPGLTWVTCGSCGVTTYARDHLETILDEARGWVARPKALAEAVVALVDSEQSVPRLYDRIRSWSSQGWIDSIRRIDEDGDEVGPRRYRLGDVLDLIHGRRTDAPMHPKQEAAS